MSTAIETIDLKVQFGPLADPLLKPGTWRFLSPQEIAAIKSL